MPPEDTCRHLLLTNNQMDQIDVLVKEIDRS